MAEERLEGLRRNQEEWPRVQDGWEPVMGSSSSRQANHVRHRAVVIVPFIVSVSMSVIACLTTAVTVGFAAEWHSAC
jgi:hypothetical protein